MQSNNMTQYYVMLLLQYVYSKRNKGIRRPLFWLSNLYCILVMYLYSTYVFQISAQSVTLSNFTK